MAWIWLVEELRFEPLVTQLAINRIAVNQKLLVLTPGRERLSSLAFLTGQSTYTMSPLVFIGFLLEIYHFRDYF
jgi:hypothetical protein